MSRLGTCVYAHQIQEIEMIPIDPQPHHRAYVETAPEFYICRWVEVAADPLPPPVARLVGAFEIHHGDCEACPYWQGADEGLLLALWQKKRMAPKSRRRRVAKAAPGG